MLCKGDVLDGALGLRERSQGKKNLEEAPAPRMGFRPHRRRCVGGQGDDGGTGEPLPMGRCTEEAELTVGRRHGAGGGCPGREVGAAGLHTPYL